MRYSDVRDSIKTGDLVAVKKRSGPFAIATRLVTKSPYTHTGIAVRVGGRLLLAQANGGGCGLVPLSQEEIYEFDVFDCPVDRTVVEGIIWDMLGTHIPYGYIDLARIFGLFVLGIPLPKDDGPDMVCSALSAMMYKKAGWAPKGLPSIPWPGAVVEALNSPAKYEVTYK
ncbi:hypothetical protein D3C87_460160 [compost metagenome]